MCKCLECGFSVCSLTCKHLEYGFSVASLPEAEIDVYLLGFAPDATGGGPTVFGPPRAGSMEGHTGHQKAGQIRGGESRVGRGGVSSSGSSRSNLEVKGHAFLMLIKLNLMTWKE